MFCPCQTSILRPGCKRADSVEALDEELERELEQEEQVVSYAFDAPDQFLTFAVCCQAMLSAESTSTPGSGHTAAGGEELNACHAMPTSDTLLAVPRCVGGGTSK